MARGVRLDPRREEDRMKIEGGCLCGKVIGIGGHLAMPPPPPPGIRVSYHGGSIGLGLDRDMESGETDRVEVAVGQCLLNRRVSGHAPEPRRRTGGDRCIELRYAVTAQFVEAVVPVLPLPPKIRA